MNDDSYLYDEQQPFAAAEFAENPEPRCPCVLLLDTSASMEGDSINQLNEGLRAFREELYNDSLSMKRVEISVVTFGPVRVLNDFTTVDEFARSESLRQHADWKCRRTRSGFTQKSKRSSANERN